jgi:tetratricopeptide (TPR) repeat protein
LDNAETVLDAPVDKAEIADVIDELGSYTSVALMLTTRDATLPCNVVWNRIDVPPLDFEAARDTFSSIYRIEKPSATSDALLNRVDFHPLSINLLAWAGAQNRWPLSKLAEQWECEKIRLLDLGKGFGKARSLSISIELSMNSPTMQDLGEAARHVLQVIAFFPTGVNQDLLLDLFPSLPTIRSIVDTLNKLSLTTCHDDFITMLMPIRLHLQKNNSVSPLLEDVRTFYYKRLGAYGSLFPGDEGFNGGTWILCEHDNVEKLIAYDLAGSEDSVDAYRACADFLVHLFWHRPRHTTLKAMVLDTPEESSLAVPKAACLQIFGWIATDMGNHAEATELLAAARSVSLSHGERWRGTQCSVNLAEINRSLENLLDAEEQFTEASTSFRDLQDLYGEARCNENLGDIARRRGNASEASRLLSSARVYYESVNKTWNVGSIRTRMGILEFDRGDYLKGREHFEAAIAIFMDIDDMSAIGWCLKKFAKAETTMGHWTEVHDLLGKARGYYLTTNCFTQAAQCLMEQGRAYGFQKEFSAAEEHLARSRDDFSLLDCRRDLAECTYISGLVKFDQGLHETAKSLWTEAREAFTAVGDAPGPADCARGLGEIAFAEGDIAGADTWFAEAKCKYEAMGLSQSKMDRHISMPRTTLGGWKLFEQGMLRSSES